MSGKNTERPGFEEMMRYLREDDDLIVCNMDRLSRSLMVLPDITGKLRQRGVQASSSRKASVWNPRETRIR